MIKEIEFTGLKLKKWLAFGYYVSEISDTLSVFIRKSQTKNRYDLTVWDNGNETEHETITKKQVLEIIKELK